MRGVARGLRVASVHGPDAGERLALPLYLCRVPAGFPSPASDYVEQEIDLGELVRNRLATFCARVEGDSMEATLRDGDLLVVDRSLEPRHGDVIVACVEGDLTVKRLLTEGGRYFLSADNPAYPRLELDGDCDSVIWGVVTYSVRRLR